MIIANRSRSDVALPESKDWKNDILNRKKRERKRDIYIYKESVSKEEREKGEKRRPDQPIKERERENRRRRLVVVVLYILTAAAAAPFMVFPNKPITFERDECSNAAARHI